MIASYRIQLTPEFGFAETVGLLDHLVHLGISHLYLSPVAEAIPGSTHGYDVVDHRIVRTDFGGEPGLRALLDAAHHHDLGVIVDHVPNHVSAAVAELNPHWWELLRDGPNSQAARWFDVDWELTGGRVLIPRLGDPLDEVLAAGELEMANGDLGPELRYASLRFPLAPGTEHLALGDAVRAQHYELMWWRDPRRNVRRFFTIDDLVAVRVEDLGVAAIVDTIPVRLAAHPAFAGVRVDHVDGLADPRGYLTRLRAAIGDDRWLLVEKILAADESLAHTWPVDGTTGYEHIRVVEHAFLDPAAEQPLTRLWVDLTDDHREFATVEDESRREVLDGGLAPDLDRLVRTINRHDDSITDPRAAAIELTIGLHRYRTYRDDGDDQDDFEHQIRRAVEHAVVARPGLTDGIHALASLIDSTPEVARRWQQLTSPTMAKGAEDRAFYRYVRLAALCEVGGDPGTLAIAADEFHRHQLIQQDRRPLGMLAGTTHDTKRSEDVRARSLVLAEIADDWTAMVHDWFDTHPDPVRRIDAATILLALETSVTAWPIDADRLTDYLVKATREADLHTSWTNPIASYERSLGALAETLERESTRSPIDHPGASGATGLARIVARTTRPGRSNSLATLAIRLTAPGVPDVYQGTEAFTYSLVDPDNRVPPDWDERRGLLAEAALLDGPAARRDAIDAAKSVVITRTLALRRRRVEAFGRDATYLPISITGPRADRLLAFARGNAEEPLVVTLTACRTADAGDWAATSVALPEGTWRDILSDDAEVVGGGTDVPVGRWLDHFAVAVLERTDV